MKNIRYPTVEQLRKKLPAGPTVTLTGVSPNDPCVRAKRLRSHGEDLMKRADSITQKIESRSRGMRRTQDPGRVGRGAGPSIVEDTRAAQRYYGKAKDVLHESLKLWEKGRCAQRVAQGELFGYSDSKPKRKKARRKKRSKR